ncbi:MAG TPA: hypothetical protein VKR56_02845 [Candidatus Cybelea sp.]|nr:hypothetical protein [Candidatus Cybelea sp.]
MKFFNSPVWAMLAAASVLAACSRGAGSSSSGLGYEGFNPAQPGAHRLGRGPSRFTGLMPLVRHPDHHKSWISPALRSNTSGRTLWASDSGLGDLYIFSLPSLTLMATMTGYDLPQGMCSDNSGDVWLTNTDTQQIFEYSHGASLINTLSDPSGFPVGCAWDHKTGNLAVTNIDDDGSAPGGILVYLGATGTPTEYKAPGVYYYYSDGYNNNSDLFFDGCPDYSECEDDTAVLGELPSNFQTPFTLTLTGTVYLPGSVQWYSAGRYLIVGDQDCSGVYNPETSCLDQVTVSGTTAKVTSSTSLLNSSGAAACDVDQAVQSGSKVYAGDFEYAVSGDFGCTSSSAPSAWYSWGYPGGTTPLRSSVPFTSSTVPNGITLSHTHA